MLDRQQCEYWIEHHYANTTLALYYHIDFAVESTVFDLKNHGWIVFWQGELTEQQLFEAEKNSTMWSYNTASPYARKHKVMA